jgi:hypothetical protein
MSLVEMASAMSQRTRCVVKFHHSVSIQNHAHQVLLEDIHKRFPVLALEGKLARLKEITCYTILPSRAFVCCIASSRRSISSIVVEYP